MPLLWCDCGVILCGVCDVPSNTGTSVANHIVLSAILMLFVVMLNMGLHHVLQDGVLWNA